jgi:hypothetical protein
MLGLTAFVGAAAWAFVVSGIARIAFKLSDNEAMIFAFLPLFLVLFIYFGKKMRTPLTKLGMLSDDPSKFGPWFRD